MTEEILKLMGTVREREEGRWGGKQGGSIEAVEIFCLKY